MVSEIHWRRLWIVQQFVLLILPSSLPLLLSLSPKRKDTRCSHYKFWMERIHNLFPKNREFLPNGGHINACLRVLVEHFAPHASLHTPQTQNPCDSETSWAILSSWSEEFSNKTLGNAQRDAKHFQKKCGKY